MNIVQKFEQAQITKLIEGKTVPDFKAGDTIKVYVKIREGVAERVQAYEGLCIAITNRGLGSSFVVRKISHGEGVERKFPLYSPAINNIEVVKRGKVRRAKIYYIRNLSGKKARIKEIRNVKDKSVQAE